MGTRALARHARVAVLVAGVRPIVGCGGVAHIDEVVVLGNFEGMTTWAIGVDQQRPFEVTTLDGPPRLVVDIATT